MIPVTAHIALGEEELQQFQAIIDMENPDLYKWLTGQTEVPAEVCAAASRFFALCI